MQSRFKEKDEDVKIHTPRNLETLNLSFRGERVAKVRIPFNVLSNWKAYLKVGLPYSPWFIQCSYQNFPCSPSYAGCLTYILGAPKYKSNINSYWGIVTFLLDRP